MCFGVGSLLTPLIARSFYLPLVANDRFSEPSNTTDGVKTTHFQPEDVKVHYAFMIIGAYVVLIGLVFFYYYLEDRRSAKYPCESKKPNETEENTIPRWKKYLAVALVAVICHIAFGVEFILGKVGYSLILIIFLTLFV